MEEALGMIYETNRLFLRPWKPTDLEPFRAINQNQDVMEHFPSPLTPNQSDALVRKIENGFRQDGFGLWAIERKDSGEFIGFIGLNRPSFAASFTPCVEIGWRLGKKHWGLGFATEGASRVLKLGFEEFDLPEIVSFTAKTNLRSIKVMERIGLQYALEFEHPGIDTSSVLKSHVLYRRRKL